MTVTLGERARIGRVAGRSRRGLDLSAGATVAGLGMAMLLFGAFVLRLWGLGRESLWVDEGYTRLFSNLSFPKLISVGGAHEHPPLYYLVCHAVLAIHNGVLEPRVVSAVAGGLSVAVLFLLGSQLFGRTAGALAAILLAISPFHLWYSQDARAYELAGLFVLLSYLCAFRALRQSSWPLWLAYAAATALALYTEYTTILALLPQCLLLLAARGKSRRFLLRSWIGVAAAFAPWMGMLALDAASIAQNYWIPSPSAQDLTATALQFLGMRTPCPSPPCVGYEAAIPLLAGHETAVAAFALVAALGTLAVAGWRRQLTVIILSLWLLVPFAVVLLISLERPIYLDRVFLDATFPLYLLVGAGAAACSRSRVGLSALAVWFVIVVASLGNARLVYSNRTNPDWKTPARDLAAAYRPGQAVIFNPAVLRPLVAAYLPPGWRPTRVVPLWSAAYLDVPSWGHRYDADEHRLLGDSRIPAKERYLRLNAELRNDQMESAARGERQVWLVTQDYSGMTESRAWLSDHGFHLLLSEIYAGDTRLELWSRGMPDGLGPIVMSAGDFVRGWARRGTVRLSGGGALEEGQALLQRPFSIQAGEAYSVNVEYQGIPPADPSVGVDTYDRQGRETAQLVDNTGNRLLGFPRTEWYNLAVNGAWLSQPFGFVAPAGSVRATIHLSNRWGWTRWRNIAVYRER